MMKKLGADNEKIFPTLAPLVDLHNSIDMPSVSEMDKEISGIPSAYTNIT